MREQIKKILELYEQGLSLGEICEEMKLTPGEFNRLLKVIRDSGYNTSKSYTSDGKIIAKINKTINYYDFSYRSCL
jgi:orotate phosphoribosyltransferase-like protein